MIKTTNNLNSAKSVFTLLIIILGSFSNNLASQDSVILQKEKRVAFEVCPYPTYAITVIGAGVIGGISYNFYKLNSFYLGGKFQATGSYGSYSRYKNRALIFEYWRFLTKDKDIYLAPYLKYRYSYVYEYQGQLTYTVYEDNAVGMGVLFGGLIPINRKESIYINLFFGLGYFIRTNYEEYQYNNNRKTPYHGDSYFRLLDFRLGCKFGFKLF